MRSSRSLSAALVLRSPAWWQWTTAVGLARLPIAMVPVAFVLAGYAATGSFANGALLASVHALSETLLAPWFGHRLDRQEARSGIQRMLLGQAISLVFFAVLVSLHAPIIMLVLAAAIVGGLPSGLFGGFRAFLPHILSPDCLEAGFTLDATLLEIEWLLAPLLVSLSVLLGSPIFALFIMGACAVLSALVSWKLPRVPPAPVVLQTRTSLKIQWSPALGVYILSGVMGLAEGTTVICLSPLMPQLGASVALAGVLAAILSFGSILGGLLYGIFLGRWPGRPRQRANVLLTMLGALLLPLLLVRSVLLASLFIGLAGLVVAPLNALRSQVLQEVIPPARRSMSFSVLYAAMGLGVGGGSLFAAAFLPLLGAHGVIAVTASIALVAGALTVFMDRDPASDRVKETESM